RTQSLTREKLNVYVNQYLTVSDNHVNSKHIYAGSVRIATKVEPQVGPRPATFFYHTDHLQDTHVISDEDQFLTEHDEYFATGEPWVQEGNPSETLNPKYLFNGKELDSATGYYYYGARYYDARLGQWLSPDPAFPDFVRERGLFTTGHLSVYTYTLNNPVMLRDPTGRQEEKDQVSLTGVRWKAETPRAVYHNFLAQDLANQGYLKLAEIAEAGHGCAYCHTVTKYRTLREADDAIDLKHYNRMALGLYASREILTFILSMSMGSPGSTKDVATKEVKEGIYEFKSASGKCYVGQSCDIPRRLEEHMRSGKLLPGDVGTVKTTEVLGGKTAREVAEQM